MAIMDLRLHKEFYVQEKAELTRRIENLRSYQYQILEAQRTHLLWFDRNRYKPEGPNIKEGKKDEDIHNKRSL